MKRIDLTKRWFLIGAGLIGLLTVFIFQRTDYLALIGFDGLKEQNHYAAFIVNRTVRLILNDAFCLLLIANLFNRKDFLRLAWWVFVLELAVILPGYLWIKLSLEGPTEISSPLLQPIHRMVVNPLLMIILMVAFYYQQWQVKKK